MAETKQQAETHPCATCAMRQRAEAEPDKLISRIWRWHTTWCPGWKSYQKVLAEARS